MDFLALPSWDVRNEVSSMRKFEYQYIKLRFPQQLCSLLYIMFGISSVILISFGGVGEISVFEMRKVYPSMDFGYVRMHKFLFCIWCFLTSWSFQLNFLLPLLLLSLFSSFSSSFFGWFWFTCKAHFKRSCIIWKLFQMKNEKKIMETNSKYHSFFINSNLNKWHRYWGQRCAKFTRAHKMSEHNDKFENQFVV